MKLAINLTESLCGFQRPVTLLDGHKILINHPPGKPVVPNSYRCIKGHGMPNRQTHSHGDLIIHFDVKFPEENFITTDSQREVSYSSSSSIDLDQHSESMSF
jgi:DnaJ-class molecular chaperone